MRSGRLEMSRRLALAGGIAAAVVAASWVDLGPVAEVELFDADRIRRSLRAGPYLDEEERRLLELPDAELVAATVQGRLEHAVSPEWRALAQRLDARGNELVLRLGDLPVDGLSARLPRDGVTRYVRIGEGSTAALVRVVRRDVTLDDFQLGSGWVGGRRPPSCLLFPWRWLAPWLAAGGILTYALLPWPRRAPNEVRYPASRLVPGDLIGLLLLVGVGGLPIVVAGGALQALVHAWPVALMLWPVAAAGALILYFCGWWSAFSVTIRDDALLVDSLRGTDVIPYDDIARRQAAVLRLPRWVRVLQWIAVLIAPAGQRPAAAGRALLYGGDVSTGTALRLRDGSTIYLWGTSPSGGSILRGSALLEPALARLPSDDEPEVVQSLTMPLRRRPSRR